MYVSYDILEILWWQDLEERNFPRKGVNNKQYVLRG
jgi:hypothetical protein